jgi:exosortase/archaeosortase family protein
MEAPSKFWKSLKKDATSRKGLNKTARFICLFLAIFLFFTYAVIPLTAQFWADMGVWHAGAVHSLLSSVFGIGSNTSGNVVTMAIQGEQVDFAISQLCSGDIEIALLISLLLASIDVLLIWRVLGAILGSILLLLINPLRIALTLAITRDSGMEAGDFYHSIIFRLFLFVILVLYYFAWYRFFIGRKSKVQHSICTRLGF